MDILKFLLKNILDNIKILLFCFHTFGDRRAIDVLDSEKTKQPALIRIRMHSMRIQGSRDYRGRLTQKVRKQKRGLLKLSRIFIFITF